MFWNNSWQVKTHRDCMSLVKTIHSLSTGQICPGWPPTPQSVCSREELWAQGWEGSCWGLGLASTVLLPTPSALPRGHSSPGSTTPPSPALPALPTTDAERDEVPGPGNASESAHCTESCPQACDLPNCTPAVVLHCFSVLQKAQIRACAFGFIFSTSKIAVHLAETVLSTGVLSDESTLQISAIFLVQTSPKDSFSYINMKVLHTYHHTQKWALLLPITIHTRLFAAWRCPDLFTTFSIGTAFCCTEILAFFCSAVQNLGWGGELALIVTEHVNTSSKAGSSFQTNADVWGGFCRGKLGFFKIWYNLKPSCSLLHSSHLCKRNGKLYRAFPSHFVHVAVTRT